MPAAVSPRVGMAGVGIDDPDVYAGSGASSDAAGLMPLLRGPQSAPRGAVVGLNDLIVGVTGLSQNADLAETRKFRFDALRGSRRKLATSEELQAVRESLKADLSQASLESKMEIAYTSTRLTDVLEAFKAEVRQALAEADVAQKQFRLENAGFIEGSVARLQQEIRVNASTLQSRVAEHLGAMELSMKAARVREVARDEAVDRSLAHIGEVCAKKTEVRWLARAQRLVFDKDTAFLQAEVERLRKDFGLQGNSLQSLADAGFAKLAALLDESNNENRNRVETLEAEVRGRTGTLEDSFRDYTEKGDELMTATVTKTENHVSAIRSETQSRLAWLDDEFQRLKAAVAVVENIPTRRVAWEVPEAAARLVHLLNGEQLRSPTFAAAGAHSLELVLSIPESERLHACAILR